MFSGQHEAVNSQVRYLLHLIQSIASNQIPKQYTSLPGTPKPKPDPVITPNMLSPGNSQLSGRQATLWYSHMCAKSMQASHFLYSLACRIHSMNGVYTDDLTFWHPFMSVSGKKDMLGVVRLWTFLNTHLEVDTRRVGKPAEKLQVTNLASMLPVTGTTVKHWRRLSNAPHACLSFAVL